MPYHSGRHFLQLPGPTNTPDRVLRAMGKPTIDHRGPEFAALTHRLLGEMRWIFGTDQTVFLYPASGSGGWEAALANTLSAGDEVLVFAQGVFARSWARVAERFGLVVRLESWDARRGLTAQAVTDVLASDEDQAIKAVLVVHNETSTGVTSDVASIGAAVRASGHSALLYVDSVSSLAVTDFRHDEWGIDVTVSGSQKGLMLPPGLALLAVGKRAMAAREHAKLPRSYWDWDDHVSSNAQGAFPYTPATHLMYGLEEAFLMLREEGLKNVFERHARYARATRAAVIAWGLEVFALDSQESSHAATAVLVPEGHDADALRELIFERLAMSLGTGLGDYKGKVFRIGHLGDLSPLSLMGTLAGVEMGMKMVGMPHKPGGVAAAMTALTTELEGLR